MSIGHGDTNSVSARSLREGTTFHYSALGETDSSRDWYHADHDIRGFTKIAFFAFIMTIWPWIFFGVLRKLGGVPFDRKMTTIVHGNPKDTAYSVTAVVSFISLYLSHLHSTAVTKIVMKRIVHKHTTISLISFFTALKNHKLDHSAIPQARSIHYIITALYTGIFTFATPGFTALLLPVPFNRTVHLTGTELDFASNDIDCIDWFNNNTIPHTCDWITYNRSSYTGCLEQNQLVDVLEAGRGNMLSLHSNNNVSISFTQLGGIDLLGSLRGVLPIGPNGATAFDTVSASSFKDAMTAPDLSYNYTLKLQGVFSNVTCAYTASIPIKYEYLVPAHWQSSLWQYEGTCPPGQNILHPALYLVPPSNNSLAFWACKTRGDSYTLYIWGSGGYKIGIGNITCSVAPFRPALFPLTYTGQSGVFAVQNHVSISPNTSTELLTRAIKGLGDNIKESQGIESNLLAESIISFGVKSFGLQSNVQNETYLRLYEAMIQGILDYEAAYIRLIYSTKVNGSTPSSCIRRVKGTAYIQMFGWFASKTTALYMIPISFINLSILVCLVVAWRTTDENGQKRLPVVDPTDPVTLMLSGDISGQWLQAGMVQPTDPMVWSDEVAFGQNKDGIHRFWPRKEVVGP